MNKLGTKAETLRVLYKKLKYSEVLPQYSFTVGQWKADCENIMSVFNSLGWNTEVIVRSSSLTEDSSDKSQAGKYESVANVPGGGQKLKNAIEKVIASYDDRNQENQVLIQPMLADVRICGVAFTLDPNTMGNYYVVNYDDGGSTTAITSGQGAENKLYYRFKRITALGLQEVDGSEGRMDRLCLALHELEVFFGQDNLDVEFAFDESDKLYILQVRTLCVQGKPSDREIQQIELKHIVDKIKQSQKKKPFLCGNKALYSVMTDWNPAEMIGIRPKPLALSLYREIITDNVWAYQRDNYGYRNLRSFPLMVDFGGLPYIDVRVSFNSFVPAGLEERLSDKLVNYYLERLADNPAKHDKAEFEIVFSCYTFDLPERIQVLREYGFSKEEVRQIIDALRNVTNSIIDHKNGLWRKDYEKIQILNKRYEEIMESDLSKIEKIYWLLEDCKRYGTLPFAGLARAAFIAVQILQSLVTCKIITKSDYESFMSGVNTVSSDIKTDFEEMTKKSFLKKYGHLRPGTYDITSLRYDEAPDLYFEWQKQRNVQDAEEKKQIFRLSLQQLEMLKSLLADNGLTNDILELLNFIKTVIEGREYGKFAFTRNLSMILQLIAEIGEEEGISKEDCAYLNILDVCELYRSARDIQSIFLHSIQQGVCKYEMAKSIVLPPVIVNSEDVLCFYYPDSEPNYITMNQAIGEVYVLDAEQFMGNLNGRIVLIASADPGYDWIFSHRIKGLITMYGGANSHMAIRAGELSIPAAVGVGAKNFVKYKKAKVLALDAGGKLIRILK